MATHRYASIKILPKATSIGRSHQHWTSGGFPAGAEWQTPLPVEFLRNQPGDATENMGNNAVRGGKRPCSERYQDHPCEKVASFIHDGL
jgi:hypothetical protein